LRRRAGGTTIANPVGADDAPLEELSVGALIVRRLLTLIPLLFVVSLGIYALTDIQGTDKAARVAARDQEAPPEVIAQVKERLGLDRPFLVRYADWLGDVARLDLGTSYATDDSVWGEFERLLPVSLSMVGVAVVFGIGIGVPLGIVSGLRPGTVADRVATMIATLGIAVPSFFIATLLITPLTIDRHWLPPLGYARMSEGFWEWLQHLLIPGGTLGMLIAAQQARQLRAALIDVMGSNYVRTAWAKGAPARRVVLKHALKNAAAPAITVLALQFTTLLGGVVVLEELFSIEGLGNRMLQATFSNDIPMVQGFVLMYVVIAVVMNLIVDIAYGLLNPKVRVT
jgi:peptide/nickel transport system permease protein